MVKQKNQKMKLKSCLILFVIIFSFSCRNTINLNSNENDYANINQYYKDLYICFNMDSLLNKERHFFLIGGQELGLMKSFFILPDFENKISIASSFNFKLLTNQDTISFNNYCDINHIIYNKIEFHYLKLIELSPTNTLMLKNLAKAKSENHLGRFDPFFITLCENTYEKEVSCITVFKGEDSSLEKFYTALVSM